MQEYMGYIGLICGVAALAVVPWIMVALKAMAVENRWYLPPFEAKYVGVALLALTGYGLTLLTVADFHLHMLDANFTVGFLYGTSGEKISREVFRIGEVVLAYLKKLRR
jgi:hypothetical protein